jgi:hypothetical protein
MKKITIIIVLIFLLFISCKTYKVGDFRGKEFEHRPGGLFVNTLTFKNDSIFEFLDMNRVYSRGKWFIDKRGRKIIIKTVDDDSLRMRYKYGYKSNVGINLTDTPKIISNDTIAFNKNKIRLIKYDVDTFVKIKSFDRPVIFFDDRIKIKNEKGLLQLP